MGAAPYHAPPTRKRISSYCDKDELFQLFTNEVRRSRRGLGSIVNAGAAVSKSETDRLRKQIGLDGAEPEDDLVSGVDRFVGVTRMLHRHDPFVFEGVSRCAKGGSHVVRRFVDLVCGLTGKMGRLGANRESQAQDRGLAQLPARKDSNSAIQDQIISDPLGKENVTLLGAVDFEAGLSKALFQLGDFHSAGFPSQTVAEGFGTVKPLLYSRG
jgi:hypothetical protein